MSLQIRMNGEIMDLTPESKVDLELLSPYLSYNDILSSSATIPNLPKTARNRAILGFPDVLQNDAVSYRYGCEKYYNGQLQQSGVAILTEAGADYSFTVVQALGEFFGDYQTKPLPDIDFGSIALPEPLTKTITAGGQKAVCFPTIANPDFYGTSGAGINYSGFMNNYHGGAYTSAGPRVPMVYLDYLLGKVAALTGTIIDGPYFDRSELRALILFNTRALDGASAVTISRHLPDLTLADFMLELRKLFNLSFTFRPAERRLTIGFTTDLLNRAARVDWSGKAVKGYKKQPETNRRLQLGSETDQGDALVKDRPAELEDYLSPDLEEPTGIAALKCRFSTLLMTSDRQTAICRQPGITAEFGQLTNTFGPRLLFYTGSEAAPTASSQLNGLSLYWTGVTGLAASFWAVNEALRNRWFYVTRDFDLNEYDVASLDFAEKVHVNGVNYLVAKVSVSLPITKPATVTLVRC